MGDYTKYLRLIKPGGNDYYNVDDFNQNSELIDKETEKLNNAVTKIQEGATREKAGIVQFGTEEGKALEGMMLARLAGCVGYGGDIQTAGTKDVNYIYYDRNTRKMYKCLNQNSDVSANVANFIPLDNNSLLDRLENLSIIHKNENGLSATIFKQNKLVVITISSNGIEHIEYLKKVYLSLPFQVHDICGAITGNNGTAGQVEITNNILKITASDKVKGLDHSFMTNLVTFIKE